MERSDLVIDPSIMPDDSETGFSSDDGLGSRTRIKAALVTSPYRSPLTSIVRAHGAP